MDAVRGLDDAPFFNWFDPAVQADPEPIVNELRARTAVVRTPLGASVLRRREVQHLLADSRLVTAVAHLVRLQSGGDGPLAGMLGDTVIAMDGPDHTPLRRLVARSFTPQAADRHRAVMRSLVDELLDDFAGDGYCEFMADFADRYPVQVICEVLGVPREVHPLFAQWSETLTYLLSFELSPRLAEVEQAANELGSYIDELVEDRRASPRDDMVTSLVEASEDDDRLSQGELRAMIAGLLFAGYDTTRNQLGRAMLTFCHRPDQWDRLVAEPDLAARSVDEVMRLAGAVVGVPRIATQDLEIGGWAIPAGPWCSSARRRPIGTRPRTKGPGHSTSPATGSPTSPSVVARTTAWVRTWLAPRWRRLSASCPAGSATSGLTGSPRGERAPASAGRATCHSGSNPPGDRSATSRRGGTKFAAIDRHRDVVAVSGSTIASSGAASTNCRATSRTASPPSDRRQHRRQCGGLTSPHAFMGRAQIQRTALTVKDHRHPLTPVTNADRRQLHRFLLLLRHRKVRSTS
jgi:cytochrome P450